MLANQNTFTQNHNQIPLYTYQDGYNKKTDNKFWQGHGEIGPWYAADENVKWCSLFGKQVGSSSKSTEFPYDSVIPFLGITQEN